MIIEFLCLFLTAFSFLVLWWLLQIRNYQSNVTLSTNIDSFESQNASEIKCKNRRDEILLKRRTLRKNLKTQPLFQPSLKSETNNLFASYVQRDKQQLFQRRSQSMKQLKNVHLKHAITELKALDSCWRDCVNFGNNENLISWSEKILLGTVAPQFEFYYTPSEGIWKGKTHVFEFTIPPGYSIFETPHVTCKTKVQFDYSNSHNGKDISSQHFNG